MTDLFGLEYEGLKNAGLETDKPNQDSSQDICGNDFLVPIPFPLPSNHSHSHSHQFPFQHCIPIPIFPITFIPIPTHYHSHFRKRLYIHYLKAEKYVYCVVNSKQNMTLKQKHCQSNSPVISHHHYNHHCLSLFTVQRLSDCHRI